MKYLIAILIILAGCKSCPEQSVIIIRDTVMNIVPPIISDSGKMSYYPDSLWQFVKYDKNAKDTIIDIRFYPKIEKVFYKVKPDTVRVRVRDTIYIPIKGRDSPEPESFFQRNLTLTYLMVISALLIAIAIIIIKIKK